MELNGDVQRYLDAQDYRGLAGYYFGLLPPEQQLWAKYALFGFVVLMLLWITWAIFGPKPRDPDALPVAVRRRRWWWSPPPGIPFKVGNEVVDLQPKRGDAIQTAIGGTTGTGKSSCVLPLLSLDIGVLIIALDNTRPISTRIAELPDGIEWSNEPSCTTAWDMLAGPPELVAEQLVAGWPKGPDTGHYRRIARIRIWDRLSQADSDGEDRSLPMLIDALRQPVESADPNVGRACRDWATKLATMHRILGDHVIGTTGDLDLVQAMREKKKVLFKLNRYLHPEDAPTLGGMLLIHARRVAQEADVPFVLIVEEAGLMDQHVEHISPLAQAARDRNVSLVLLTQNLSKLPPEVRNNISVWISFAQEDDVELKFAANRLRLKPTDLWREAFKDEGRRWAYVRGPGTPTTLVKIQEVKPLVVKRPKARPTPVVIPSYAYSTERFEQPALNHWRPYPLSLPEPSVNKERPPDWVGSDPDLLRFWGQMIRTGRETPLWSPGRGVWWDEGGCLEWHGPLSKPKSSDKLGRPRSNRGRGSVTVYVETAHAAGKLAEPTWDHDCDNPICVNPDHGNPASILDNNKRRSVRALKLEEAWLEKLGQIPPWWANRHHERVVSDCECHQDGVSARSI